MVVSWSHHMGVSENRGPEYSTLNSRIHIIRTPKEGTLIFGNSHILVFHAPESV